MKNTTMKVSLHAAAALGLMAVPGFAQQGQVSVKVPFEFTAGSTTLPAGDYEFHEEPNGVLLISSASQHKAVLVLTTVAADSLGKPQSAVKFDKTGDQYALTEVDVFGAPSRRVIRLDRENASTALLSTKIGVTNGAAKGLKK